MKKKSKTYDCQLMNKFILPTIHTLLSDPKV